MWVVNGKIKHNESFLKSMCISSSYYLHAVHDNSHKINVIHGIFLVEQQI